MVTTVERTHTQSERAATIAEGGKNERKASGDCPPPLRLPLSGRGQDGAPTSVPGSHSQAFRSCAASGQCGPLTTVTLSSGPRGQAVLALRKPVGPSSSWHARHHNGQHGNARKLMTSKKWPCVGKMRGPAPLGALKLVGPRILLRPERQKCPRESGEELESVLATGGGAASARRLNRPASFLPIAPTDLCRSTPPPQRPIVEGDAGKGPPTPCAPDTTSHRMRPTMEAWNHVRVNASCLSTVRSRASCELSSSGSHLSFPDAATPTRLRSGAGLTGHNSR